MEEYYTQGIVITRAWAGERDATVIAYTEMFGKIRAKVCGVQKLTSKLSGHLVPGIFADLRIVERKNGGFQIVESFSQGCKSTITAEIFSFLHVINTIVPLEERDERVWKLLTMVMQEGIYPTKVYRPLLTVLGFGPDHATCSWCNGFKVRYFIPQDVVFLCGSCFNREKETHGEAITF
ncbi:MAG: recombination protein O N-terminal domain-containing protein [bacterium]